MHDCLWLNYSPILATLIMAIVYNVLSRQQAVQMNICQCYTRKEHWTWSTKMAAMASKFDWQNMLYAWPSIIQICGKDMLWTNLHRCRRKLDVVAVSRRPVARCKAWLWTRQATTPRDCQCRIFASTQGKVRNPGCKSMLSIYIYQESNYDWNIRKGIPKFNS